ncbi:MAG: homocysteine S-methyltransferase family protein [Candidatus Sericytochromatia bacterium]|nr:homocysteine S-methyltransferase family protein [Candidatus Sericytochromatia bacterium]
MKPSTGAAELRLGDGALGTELLGWLRPDLPCVDLLNVFAPERVQALHRAYWQAGARLLRSNSFCCDPDSLAGTPWAEHYDTLTRIAVCLLKKTLPQALIAGVLGPGWRLPGRNQIAPDQLYRIYCRRAAAVVAGGADIFWIETVQDPLQAEIAVQACMAVQPVLPLAVLVSPDADGQTVGGLPLDTVLQRLVALPLQILGVNCSWGPSACLPALQWLRAHSPHALAVYPNGGLPDQPVVDWPVALLDIQRLYQPAWLGGCCGVGPAAIARLRQDLSA